MGRVRPVPGGQHRVSGVALEKLRVMTGGP
jgi:hypothetical protein